MVSMDSLGTYACPHGNKRCEQYRKRVQVEVGYIVCVPFLWFGLKCCFSCSYVEKQAKKNADVSEAVSVQILSLPLKK